MNYLTLKCFSIIIFQSGLIFCQLKTVPELITSNGFEYEEHTVMTEDGYLLGVFRIVNPYVKDKRILKPFLFIHGLMVNSASWIMNGEGWFDKNGVYYESNGDKPPLKVNCHPKVNDANVNTQGFALAACGYDVWLLNTRGTKYSIKHKDLNVNDVEFWRFSFQEIGWYDIPATIDYILNKTNKNSLSVAGHSQGTSALFVYLSSKPDDGKTKVNLCILMSSTIFWGNFFKRWPGYSLIKPIINSGFKIVDYILRLIDGPIDLHFGLAAKLVSWFDVDSSILNTLKSIVGYICDSDLLSFANGGLSVSTLNMTRLSIYMSCLDILSTYATSHYAQLYVLDDFVYHNRDHRQNMELYDQVKPPKVPLENVKNTKIILIQGSIDISSDQDDIKRLKNALTVPIYGSVTVDEFRHGDFMASLRLGKELNTRILRWLKNTSTTFN